MFAANKVPAPPGVTHLYEAQGCPDCRETGYKGRIALMELCPFNHELADLVAANAPQGEMRKIATGMGLRTLYQEGLQQVLEGETSLEEIKCLAYTAVAEGETASEDAGQDRFDI
jgi:type II secretory ATPase GspE/PulE/Tfp pilus assembly ATPase PilB-like protein